MSISLKLKKDIISYKENNSIVSYTMLGNKFGLHKQTVYKIYKNREIIKNINVPPESNITKIQSNNVYNIERNLIDWVNNVTNVGLVITDKLIIKKAKNIYNLLLLTDTTIPKDFKFSNGWLQGFKKRNNISHVSLVGESASVNKQYLDIEINKLKLILSQYSPENIINADETGLFYRMIPKTTLAIKKKNQKGFKKDKSRITIVLACTASGSKIFEPWIISVSKVPKGFNNTLLKNLKLQYDCSATSWMTKIIWEKYILYLDSVCTVKSILLIDNFRAHLIDYDKLNLKFIKIHFLPPNTTSMLQPCDAGIIHNFKVFYRNLLCDKYLQEYESGCLNYKLSLLESIKLIASSWNSIKAETISNCWYHTKIISKKELINTPKIAVINEKKISNDFTSHENYSVLETKLLKLSEINKNISTNLKEHIMYEDDDFKSENINDIDIINYDIIKNIIVNNNIKIDEQKNDKNNLIDDGKININTLKSLDHNILLIGIKKYITDSSNLDTTIDVPLLYDKCKEKNNIK